MSSATERFKESVAAAVDHAMSKNARQLEREARTAHLAKLRARREEKRRRLELGGAVLIAGCGDLTVVEIIGLLLDSKDRVGASPTMRLAIRKRGQDRFASVGPSTRVNGTSPADKRRDVTSRDEPVSPDPHSPRTDPT